MVEGVMTVMHITSAEDKARRRLEVKARSTLKMGILNEHQLKFNSIKDAKQLLEAEEKRFGENAAIKKTQRNLLKQQYENFIALSSDMLDQTFDRLQKLMSQLEHWDEKLFTARVLNKKLLRSKLPKWNTHAVVWRNKADLDTMSMDDLSNNLKVQPNSPQLAHEDLQQIHPDDIEEIDLRWQMAIPKWSATTATRGEILLGSAELQEIKTIRTRKAQERVCLWKHLFPQLFCHVMVLVDMTRVIRQRKGPIMYNPASHLPNYKSEILRLKVEIHIGEITIRELRKKLEIAQKKYDIQLNVDKFENASKSLNKLIDCQIVDNCKKDEFVNEPVVENYKAMSSEEEPKFYRIKVVIDSGCSRHMTGNMSYLTDYKEIDGGYVAFEGNPKGGKITENVPLKLLIDESQVLLRVPRKNNMYSVDLKDILPKGEVMEFESAQSNTTAKLPILKLGEYEMWVIRIKQKQKNLSFIMSVKTRKLQRLEQTTAGVAIGLRIPERSATYSSSLTKPIQKIQVILVDILENLVKNDSIVAEHGLSSKITQSPGRSSDTSKGSENSGSFEDMVRSDCKEYSEDGSILQGREALRLLTQGTKITESLCSVKEPSYVGALNDTSTQHKNEGFQLASWAGRKPRVQFEEKYIRIKASTKTMCSDYEAIDALRSSVLGYVAYSDYSCNEEPCSDVHQVGDEREVKVLDSFNWPSSELITEDGVLPERGGAYHVVQIQWDKWSVTLEQVVCGCRSVRTGQELYTVQRSVQRIESARATPKAHLPYGMFLTRLFRHVMEHYPYLDNGIYNAVDRVMHPLALKQTWKPRSDRGKARHSV
ncbi:hypothetical protein Tco_1102164 [Tanacetum coccineum]